MRVILTLPIIDSGQVEKVELNVWRIVTVTPRNSDLHRTVVFVVDLVLAGGENSCYLSVVNMQVVK